MNRKWKIGLACLVFLLALGITLYPLISTMYNNRHQSLIHTQYNQEIANANHQVIEESRSLAKQYNTALVPGAQQVDAFSSAAVEPLNLSLGLSALKFEATPCGDILLFFCHSAALPGG